MLSEEEDRGGVMGGSRHGGIPTKVEAPDVEGEVWAVGEGFAAAQRAQRNIS